MEARTSSIAGTVAPRASPARQLIDGRAHAGVILWYATTAVVAAALTTSIMSLGIVVRRAQPEIVSTTLLVGSAVSVAVALLVAVDYIARRRPAAALIVAMTVLASTRLGLTALVDAPVVSDWGRYHRLALGALQGAPPVADIPMGYPILLGAAYRLGGVSVASGEALNVALSIGAAGCLAAWVWLVAGGRPAALAVTVLALTPSNAFFATLLASENAFAVAVSAVVLGATLMLRTLAHGRGAESLLSAVVVGTALGLAAYVRTTSFALLPLFAAMPLVVRIPVRRAVLVPLTVLLAAAVALVPVVAWNRAITDRWSVSTSQYLGWQLYVGLNVEKRGAYNTDDELRVNSRVPGKRRSVSGEYAAGRLDPSAVKQAVERDAVAMELATERLREDATRIPLMLPFKFARAWGSGDNPVTWALSVEPERADRRLAAAAHLGSQLWWTALLAVGTAWFVRERRRRPEYGYAVSAVVLPIAFALLLLEAQARYHEPVVPLLAGLAGIILADVRGGANLRRTARDAVAAS